MGKSGNRKGEERPVVDWELVTGLKEEIGPAADLLQRRFLERLPEWLERVAAAIATGNSVRVEEAAHFLKGACRQVGGVRVAAVTSLIEKKGEAGELEGLDGLMAELRREASRLQRELNAYLEEETL